MSQRSTKLREIHLKHEILSAALNAFPESSPLASSLSSLRVQLDQEDLKLRPWRSRKLAREKTQEAASSSVHPPDVRTKCDIEEGPMKMHCDGLIRGSLEWCMENAIEAGKADTAMRLSDMINERKVTTSRLVKEQALHVVAEKTKTSKNYSQDHVPRAGD
ncbi:unnamed protein product [Calicophoron daubneyi]